MMEEDLIDILFTKERIPLEVAHTFHKQIEGHRKVTHGPDRQARTCLLLPIMAAETRGFSWTGSPAGPRPRSLRVLPPREPARNADPQASAQAH